MRPSFWIDWTSTRIWTSLCPTTTSIPVTIRTWPADNLAANPVWRSTDKFFCLGADVSNWTVGTARETTLERSLSPMERPCAQMSTSRYFLCTPFSAQWQATFISFLTFFGLDGPLEWQSSKIPFWNFIFFQPFFDREYASRCLTSYNLKLTQGGISNVPIGYFVNTKLSRSCTEKSFQPCFMTASMSRNWNKDLGWVSSHYSLYEMWSNLVCLNGPKMGP